MFYMKQLNITPDKPELTERNLFLCKGVDQDSIQEITSDIIKINEEDDIVEKLTTIYGHPHVRHPIKIYIDSYGGFVYQMFGLISIMDKSKTPIHTFVTGCAMSAGFMLLISGHKRFAYENATPMYHQVSSWSIGTVKEMEERVIEAKRLQEMIEKQVLKRTKITKKKLEDVYAKNIDWFMTAKEAKILGVVDDIV